MVARALIVSATISATPFIDTAFAPFVARRRRSELQVESRGDQWEHGECCATARNPFSLLRTLSNQVWRPARRGQGEGGAVLNHKPWDTLSFSQPLAEERDPGERANVPPGGWPVDCSPSSENSRLKQPPWVCTGEIIGARALGVVTVGAGLHRHCHPLQLAFTITCKLNVVNGWRIPFALVTLNHRRVNRATAWRENEKRDDELLEPSLQLPLSLNE